MRIGFSGTRKGVNLVSVNRQSPIITENVPRAASAPSLRLLSSLYPAIQINAMKTCFHNAKCSFSIAKVEKIKVPCKSIMVHTVKTLKIVYEV